MTIITTNHFHFITDRWGDIDDHSLTGNLYDFSTCLSAMFDEISFVVRDKRNGNICLLLEVEYETPNIANLEIHVKQLQESFGCEAFISQHEMNFNNRICVHVVVPVEACAKTTFTATIGEEMLNFALA